ncbi:MAG: hypothetical protein ACOC2U_04040, partial [bacterium]
PLFCWNLVITHKLISFLFSKSVNLFQEKTCSCIGHNGWRYEKLPIAGDFLSIYTKAAAGYNP